MGNRNFAPTASPSLFSGKFQKTFQVASTNLPPPVIVNLREDRGNDRHARDLLTAAELSHFRNNGGNAVIFIHGYNVPYGEYSKHVQQVSRPIDTRLHHSASTASDHLAVLWSDWEATTYRNLDIVAQRFPLLKESKLPLQVPLTDENLNGSGAHNWFIFMEDNLNRGAGFDYTDYTRYTRIINIAWSGDVATLDYMEAEKKAEMPGRKVAGLIRQLADTGIKVNVIAHSLGNRVLVGAMNELGKDPRYAESIYNAFMWQAAIPDTALSDGTSRDSSIPRNCYFPHAHKAAKRIVILHSTGDNILGPHESFQAFYQDLQNGDVAEAGSGAAGGAYRVATQIGVPPDELGKRAELVKKSRQAFWEDAARKIGVKLHTASDRLRPQPTDYWLRDVHPEMYIRRIGREFGPGGQRAAEEVLRFQWQYRGPRPAMGHRGPHLDRFIRSLLNEKIILVDQKKWLFGHSEMKRPTSILFDEVYKKRILDRILISTGFGRYE